MGVWGAWGAWGVRRGSARRARRYAPPAAHTPDDENRLLGLPGSARSLGGGAAASTAAAAPAGAADTVSPTLRNALRRGELPFYEVTDP